jgi:hypothetical protein
MAFYSLRSALFQARFQNRGSLYYTIMPEKSPFLEKKRIRPPIIEYIQISMLSILFIQSDT